MSTAYREVSEKDVERKAALWAKNHGMIAVKLHGDNQRGIPDRMFCYSGYVLFIEFKKPLTGELSHFQKAYQIKLKQHGFVVHNVDNYEQTLQILKKWKGDIDVARDTIREFREAQEADKSPKGRK